MNKRDKRDKYVYTPPKFNYIFGENIKKNYNKSVMDNKIPRKENGGFFVKQ